MLKIKNCFDILENNELLTRRTKKKCDTVQRSVIRRRAGQPDVRIDSNVQKRPAKRFKPKKHTHVQVEHENALEANDRLLKANVSKARALGIINNFI